MKIHATIALLVVFVGMLGTPFNPAFLFVIPTAFLYWVLALIWSTPDLLKD